MKVDRILLNMVVERLPQGMLKWMVVYGSKQMKLMINFDELCVKVDEKLLDLSAQCGKKSTVESEDRKV